MTGLNFYPRSPCGERLHALLQGHFIVTISIHALLAESDGKRDCGKIIAGQFLSTLSLRRATHAVAFQRVNTIQISIHALLAESDTSRCRADVPRLSFLSTLSLRRATYCTFQLKEIKDIFLSTLSLRRATLCRPAFAPAARNFYPRSPCGERPCRSIAWRTAKNFYPRSPCGERPSSSTR